MKKITLNNLAALVQGREMTLYQRSLAVQEFDSVVNYLRELEESEKANVSHTGEMQSNIPDVKDSLPDKDNYDYLRGFSDGYGGPEPHECFPEGFKDINEVMDRMWELGEQRK